MSFSDQAPQVPTGIPTNFSLTSPSGESIRHILLGRPGAIRQTIHLLHNLLYAETSQWSPLIEIPDNQLILTSEHSEMISLLAKRL